MGPDREPWLDDDQRNADNSDRVLAFAGWYARRVQSIFCLALGIGLPFLVIVGLVQGMPFGPEGLATLGILEIAVAATIWRLVNGKSEAEKMAGRSALFFGVALLSSGAAWLLIRIIG